MSLCCAAARRESPSLSGRPPRAPPPARREAEAQACLCPALQSACPVRALRGPPHVRQELLPLKLSQPLSVRKVRLHLVGRNVRNIGRQLSRRPEQCVERLRRPEQFLERLPGSEQGLDVLGAHRRVPLAACSAAACWAAIVRASTMLPRASTNRPAVAPSEADGAPMDITSALEGRLANLLCSNCSSVFTSPVCM